MLGAAVVAGWQSGPGNRPPKGAHTSTGLMAMHWTLRLVVACIAGVAAGAAAYWLVGYILIYGLGRNDPGVGGGLIGVAAGLVATIAVGGAVYRILPRPRA